MQTFIQEFRAYADKPVTRAQVARALRNIADDLERGVVPNPPEAPWSIDSLLTFDLHGYGEIPHGRIVLHFND